MRDDSEQVQRICMARLHREDMPVNALRFRKLSDLVVSERSGESLLNVHGRTS